MDIAQVWFRNFSLYFETLANKAVEYNYDNDSQELIVKLDDGRIIAYDEYSKRYRLLPRDGACLSEEDWKVEFGKRLKRIMWVKGISQTDLSDRTGIGQTLISRYISGKTTPSVYNVNKIARALNMTVDGLTYNK